MRSSLIGNGMYSQIPVVATKLSLPVTSARVLLRPRLAATLQSVRNYRLSLVCAGPGNGKTTLLVKLPDVGYPVVWYSLGRMDRDLPVFLSHLIAGIARHYDGFGQTWWESSQRLEKEVDVILSSLVNELVEKAKEHIFIVLDDYHVVEQSRAVNYVVDYLLSYLPANVHLAIASRTYPYFPCLARLQASGQVLNVREEDLRFTEEEVAELFMHAFDRHLDSASLAAILDHTESWAIGLQLIGQLLRGSAPKTGLDAVFAASKDTMLSYFAEEVLKKLPLAIQALLVDSSIFSRLNARVCDAVLGRSDTAKILSNLERKGMLLLRLDDEGYRFHHLFQAFLQEQLSLDATRKRTLHQRAAAFFEDGGHDEQAITHCLHAEDYAKAATLISKVSERLFSTRRFDSLSYFINELPREVTGMFPDLLIWAGKVSEAQGKFDEALRRYDTAECLYQGSGNSLGLSRTLSSKGDVLLWAQAEPGEAENLHRRALDYLGDASRLERAAILVGLANDAICAGNSAAALEFYHSALHIYVEEADEMGEMRTLINPGAIVRFTRGEFAEALGLLERAEQLAIKLDAKQDLGECYYSRAASLLFLGDYAGACAVAKKALELAYDLDNKDLEARAFLITGNALDGIDPNNDPIIEQRFRQGYDIAEQHGNRRVSVLTLVGMANHYRRKGDLLESERLARRALQTMGEATDQWLRAFVLRHLGMVEAARNLPSALQTLTESWLAFAKCEDQFNLTCTHWWLAAVHEARGEIDDERYHLQKCLELASASNYVAPFVTEPQMSSHLLRDALSWKLSITFVRVLLMKMGSVGVQVILSLLSHHDIDVRLEAINCLMAMGGVRAAMHLRELAREKDERVRSAAVDALRKIEQDPAEALRINLFGQVTVMRGETLIDASAWKRKKAKALLAYLGLQKAGWVHRDVLIDKLWPEADWQSALNQLNVAVHDLRQVLEPEREELAQSRYVLYRDSRYRLSPGQGGSVDVELFELGLQAASLETDTDRAITKLEEATQLYKGELMHDLPQEEWSQIDRDRLAEQYLSALERLADLYERKRDFDAALACYKRILSLDTCREEIHRALINLYAKTGSRRDAIKQYRLCETALHEELGVRPEQATRLAYEKALSCSS
ncbi:MAG: HEAT repeat domain-containing protein [Chloroflexi bacterium]|nr:HEAT repeat domain-containing protein [Chloroflexota bacterium]